MQAFFIGAPLQVAPQMAQVRVTFFFPALPSSRLPQSLQKMREPIADMVVNFVVMESALLLRPAKKWTGSRNSLRRAGTPASAALVWMQ